MTKVTENFHNIVCIVADDLCTGCGFCVPCCPKGAIKMSRNSAGFFVPIVVDKDCIKCGTCLDICAGPGLNLYRSSQDLSGAVNYDALLGRYIKACVGWATDPDISRYASSGGVITALLLYLLRRKIVDGAIVVTMDNENPLYAKAVVATREEDVIHAIGSKYTPVSMSEVIGQILSIAENRNFVFIGLPCHLETLSKAEKRISKLRRSIVLKIGLYCNNTPSVDATKYVLERLKVPVAEVVRIRYRGDGWPGYMTIELKGNRKVRIPFTNYWDSGFGQFFCRKRCILCADQTAELADISLADPWTLDPWAFDVKPNKQVRAKSLILVRTTAGQRILNEALQDGFISLNDVDPRKAVQLTTMSKKTNKLSHSIQLILGIKSLPHQTNYALPLTLHSVIWLFRYRVCSFLAKYVKTWPLLRACVAVHFYATSLISLLKNAFLARTDFSY